MQGDTDKVAIGRGTYASRSVMVGGNALKAAADAVIAKGRKMAALLLEAKPDEVEFAEGLFRVQGTNKSMPLQEVAKVFYRPRWASPWTSASASKATAPTPASPATSPTAATLCEVEMDPETGVVTVVR